MNYEQALKYINSTLKFGTKLGLETTTELLRRVGNPHNKLKFIHIAGTNGKGSTSAYISNILIANGHKTGMFISPFIHSFTERIQINNCEITKDALARHTQTVANAIDDSFQPTEFEIITAIGMLYFLEQGCDYVVLEVGLGGRFDATNVIPTPLLCVITSISIDHTELLGNTIEQIAFEKCGIIKESSTVIAYADNSQEANDVIYKTVKEKNAHVIFADRNNVSIISQNIDGTKFIYDNEIYKIAMLGTHQVYNALTAITAAKALKIPQNSIEKGLASTHFCGRFEVVNQTPTVIIDGAHNYSGVIALKDALQMYFKGNKITLIMGMLKDKEYAKCVEQIAPMANLFIATQPDNPRALPAQELANVAKKFTNNINVIENKDSAVQYAIENTQPNDILCICGSLYLIGGMNNLKNLSK